MKNKDVILMGMRFAQLERKLGEIDRARTIYIHISQFTNPQEDIDGFWTVIFLIFKKFIVGKSF